MADDHRFAERRAATLAGRGAGDALVRHDLRAAGVANDVAEAVVAGLEPEIVRAEHVADRRGRDARTARYLAAKGFAEDVVSAVVAPSDGEALG